MLVLDTDHLGEFQKGTSLAAQRLKRRLDDATVPVATTVVSVEEVMRGWLAAIRREARPADQIRSYGRLLALFSFFATWDILAWEESAVKEFESLRQRKIRIGLEDRQYRVSASCHPADCQSSRLPASSRSESRRLADMKFRYEAAGIAVAACAGYNHESHE